MFRKCLTIVLLLALVFSLAACGGGSDGASPPEGASDPQNTNGGSSQELPDDVKKLIDNYIKPVDKMPEKKLRIAVLGAENSPFWYDVKAGANVADIVLEKYNTEVDWIVPSGGEKSQGTDVFGPGIEAALVKQYDAIATLGPDDSIIPYIERARTKGIPVATFNTDAPGLTANQRLVFVGQDLYDSGKQAAEVMAKAIGGKGKVAVITGYFNISALQQRVNGFEDHMKEKYPDIKIVGVTENKVQDNLSYSQTIDFMNANPDLKGIYVTVADTGAGRAVLDKKADVKVVNFDYNAQEIELIKKGGIYTVIGQDPFAQGYKVAIQLFNNLVAGEKPEDPMDYTGYQIINKDNVAEFEALVKIYEQYYEKK